MLRSRPNRARGFSLLELIVTAAMMATLATTVAIVLRSAQSAWAAHDTDHARLQAAHATLRHISRQLRQAEGIISVSAPGDSSGSISALTPDGTTVVWEHVPGRVNYGVTTATSLLAEGIEELSFTAYRADGATTTMSGPDIHSILCRVKVAQPYQAAGNRTFSARIWLRAW